MALDNYYKALTLTKTTSTEWGGIVDVVTNWTGFIQPISGGEVFKNGRAGEEITHRLYIATNFTGVYRDKVIQNSISYRIVYSNQVEGISSVDHHKEILLELF